MSIETSRNVGKSLCKGFISVSTLLLLKKRVRVLLSMKIALFKEQGYPNLKMTLVNILVSFLRVRYPLTAPVVKPPTI